MNKHGTSHFQPSRVRQTGMVNEGRQQLKIDKILLFLDESSSTERVPTRHMHLAVAEFQKANRFIFLETKRNFF
jgi:hypothetical protein